LNSWFQSPSHIVPEGLLLQTDPAGTATLREKSTVPHRRMSRQAETK